MDWNSEQKTPLEATLPYLRLGKRLRIPSHLLNHFHAASYNECNFAIKRSGMLYDLIPDAIFSCRNELIYAKNEVNMNVWNVWKVN